VRLVLRDIEQRYYALSAAEDEFSTLERRNIYVTLVRRMRLWVRQASFTWKSDQIAFLQAVTSFYQDYGNILRRLKIEMLRGRLADQPLVNTKGV